MALAPSPRLAASNGTGKWDGCGLHRTGTILPRYNRKILIGFEEECYVADTKEEVAIIFAKLREAVARGEFDEVLEKTAAHNPKPDPEPAGAAVAA